MQTKCQTKKLEEICEKGSSNVSQNQLDRESGEYPIYGASGFIKNISFFHQKNEYVSIVKDGSGVGRVSLMPAKSSVIGTSQYLIPKEGIDVRFLFYVLNNVDFSKYKNGAAIPHIYFRDYSKEEFKVPAIAEQKRIVKKLDEVFENVTKAKEAAEKNLQNAKELFESYLQSVFANPGKDWQEFRLGDKELLNIIDGDRGKNYPKKSDFLADGYCLFMNTKNVRPDGFDFTTTMFVTEKKDKALGNGKLQRDDVVMTTRGTIGNLGLYSDDVEHDNIRINSGMLIFRPNTEKISPDYLFEILRSGIVRAQIKKHVSGAAQPQLPIKTLIHFTIPVPKSLLEQKSIVKKLKLLSAETKKLQKIYEQKLADLEELKKSVLNKAFRAEL